MKMTYPFEKNFEQKSAQYHQKIRILRKDLHIGDEMELEKIRELALANGFSLKEQASGNMDLHSYVYEFANALLKEATPEGFVLLPIEPTKAIKTALSYQCFDFIAVAQTYRNLGFDIPKKAEDEQSFFLHKFLILAIEHGNNFIKVFNAETKALIKAQEQSHD